MTSARRIARVAVLSLSGCLGGLAAPARADSTGNGPCQDSATGLMCETHGDRFRDRGGADNGTRAWIGGSGNFNSFGELWAYVSVQTDTGVQEDSTGGAGLAFAGELSRLGDQDACGTPNGDFAFFAYRVHGLTTIHCPYHAASGFGDGHNFAVQYNSGAWTGKKDGAVVGTAPALGFTSGWSVAADLQFTPWNLPGNGEAITFGPANHNPWGYSTNGGTTYSIIDFSAVDQNTDTDAPIQDSDGDWGLGGTPSPFNLNWTGNT